MMTTVLPTPAPPNSAILPPRGNGVEQVDGLQPGLEHLRDTSSPATNGTGSRRIGQRAVRCTGPSPSVGSPTQFKHPALDPGPDRHADRRLRVVDARAPRAARRSSRARAPCTTPSPSSSTASSGSPRRRSPTRSSEPITGQLALGTARRPRVRAPAATTPSHASRPRSSPARCSASPTTSLRRARSTVARYLRVAHRVSASLRTRPATSTPTRSAVIDSRRSRL